MHHLEAVDPRAAVLERLNRAHTRFVQAERQAWREGKGKQAEALHENALRTLRAYAAERDDPDIPDVKVHKRFPPR